jgi:hypothetical protein
MVVFLRPILEFEVKFNKAVVTEMMLTEDRIVKYRMWL